MSALDSASPATKVSLKDRLRSLMVEYGQLVLWVYLAIFVIVFIGFSLAIHLGFDVKGASATAGTLAAAYIATKLTTPLRFGATLVLTPLIMKLRRRKNP